MPLRTGAPSCAAASRPAARYATVGPQPGACSWPGQRPRGHRRGPRARQPHRRTVHRGPGLATTCPIGNDMQDGPNGFRPPRPLRGAHIRSSAEAPGRQRRTCPSTALDCAAQPSRCGAGLLLPKRSRTTIFPSITACGRWSGRGIVRHPIPCSGSAGRPRRAEDPSDRETPSPHFTRCHCRRRRLKRSEAKALCAAQGSP